MDEKPIFQRNFTSGRFPEVDSREESGDTC